MTFAARRNERRAFRKAVTKAIPALLKGSGWRSKYGWPYREQAGWFIHQQETIYGEEARTTASVHAKPMALDDLFWDIGDLSDNRSKPASLRMVGAFACHLPGLIETEIAEGDSAGETAARIVENVWSWEATFEAATALELVWVAVDPARWTHLSHRPNGAAYTCLLALSGRVDDAINFCEERISAGDPGGFPNIGRDRKGFYPSAIQWFQSEFDANAYPSFATIPDHSASSSA